MRVQPFGEDDWVAFREIRLRSLIDSPDAFGSTYGDESSQTERAWRDWAAGRWRGGTAIAFAGLGMGGDVVGTATGAEFDAEPGVGHLYAMWVAPEARGAGIGRALVDAVVEWTRARGCTRLVLSVTETNEGARRFYERCGFAATGERRPLREGADVDALMFAKRL
jgi:ribosomal protein S18 acetylase RimI-like enzyme